MAITLVTATPGGGKTAYVVGVLMQEAHKAGRPIFSMGIPDLKVPHTEVPPISEWTEQRPDSDDPSVMLPYFTFPPNSFIVVDEAQRVYRPRAAASRVPDHVAAFETHRHTGVDFVLITQNPSLLDTNIRKLVSRHLHFRDIGVLGRRMYEWPECSEAIQWKTAPIAKKYKLPKQAFSLYKSSSLHIKPSYTVPPVLKLLIACGVVVAALGWYLTQSIGKRTGLIESNVPGVQSSASSPSDSSTEKNPLEAFIPRIPSMPETAPAYDEIRKVSVMPFIVGCMIVKSDSESFCRCYTQQMTRVVMEEGACVSRVKDAPFNPYQTSQSQQVVLASSDAVQPVQQPVTRPVRGGARMNNAELAAGFASSGPSEY